MCVCVEKFSASVFILVICYLGNDSSWLRSVVYRTHTNTLRTCIGSTHSELNCLYTVSIGRLVYLYVDTMLSRLPHLQSINQQRERIDANVCFLLLYIHHHFMAPFVFQNYSNVGGFGLLLSPAHFQQYYYHFTGYLSLL